MAFYKTAFETLRRECQVKNVTLVAVSKMRTEAEIMQAYEAQQLDFGENYVQELISKAANLPKNIRWHFIGHLQSNKVKYIAPFIHLIHGIDNIKLLQEVNKQAIKLNKKINCLLQVHIAKEETKFGFDPDEIASIDFHLYPNVNICGLMGMASFTDDTSMVRKEFQLMHQLYTKLQTRYPTIKHLSMGMSGDHAIAIEEGSNMIRVGSLLFGERK